MKYESHKSFNFVEFNQCLNLIRNLLLVVVEATVVLVGSVVIDVDDSCVVGSMVIFVATSVVKG